MRGRYILPSFLSGCLAGEFLPFPHRLIPYTLLLAFFILMLHLFFVSVCRRPPCVFRRICASHLILKLSNRFILSPYYYEKAITWTKTLSFSIAFLLLGLANSQRMDSVDLQKLAESRAAISVRKAMESSIKAFFADSTSFIPSCKPPNQVSSSGNSCSMPPYFLQNSNVHDINSNERAVLRALVLGNKSELSSELKASYRDSGASHILALSGMHIGIIYSTLMVLLSFMNSHYLLHRCKLPVALIFMLLYVLATGFSPSACRAVIMIGLTLWTRLSGRTSFKETPLFLSAFLLLLLDPHISRSLSFQLSFVAMGGIVFIFSTIDSILKPSFEFYISPFNRRGWRKKARAFLPLCAYYLLQVCAVSVSCQIATMPLTLYYFGTVPKYFLITNLLASPLVTLIIYVFVMFSVLWGALNLSFSGTIVCSVVAGAGGFLLYNLLHLLNSLMAYIGN